MKVNKNDLNRKVYALKDFRGVDYASSPMEVKPYRATDMANLLLRDGMLHKRYGFKQRAPVSDKLAFDKQYEIKCLQWGTVASSGRGRYVLQCLDIQRRKSTFLVYHESSLEASLEHERASKLGNAVIVGEELYIFCGVYIKIFENSSGEYTLEEIGEDNAYIPTTMTDIPIKYPIYNSESGSYNNYSVEPGIDQSYLNNESLNLLTRWSKYALIGSKILGGNHNLAWGYYRLPIRVSIYASQIPKIIVKINETGEEKEFNDFEKQTLTLDEWTGAIEPKIYGYNEERMITGIARFVSPSTGIEIGSAMEYLVEDSDKNDPYTGILYIPVNYAGKFRGFNFGDSTNERYVAISEVTIYVQLFDYSREPSSLITSASVATTFGVDGAEDRIFVSGANEQPNTVYFSANDISFKPNPTYFPVDQFLVCGLSNSPISGFMKITDGTMAIFKDVTNVDDVSVFYTSGYYQDLGTDETGNTHQRAIFTVRAGDIRRKGISAKAINNFEGDNIFVAEDGVYDIQLSSNVASGERYARERSRTINPKIRNLNLSNAKGIVFKDKYYLAVDNGEVYVADARYKFSLEGDQQDTFNYEWFRLTGLRVKEWILYGDKLRFIDEDGYMCEFTEGFADQYRVSTDNNELTVNDGTVTFNNARLDLVKSALYAVDNNGNTWSVVLTEDQTAIKIPEDIEIEAGSVLTLWFCVSVPAYWQSAVLDLENPMIRKNMWSLSVTACAEYGGMINLGYKTRLKAVNNIQIEGANANTFENINFLGGEQTSLLSGESKGFGMYTFDTGGFVGINSYRRRIFERNFVFLQLLFESETANDCVVNEIDVEYAIARKNIGVG